ncbi:MAG: J domain-containing protein [bacterium]
MNEEKRHSYYRELGVQPDATPNQIRNAYRMLAKRYHPDRNPGDKKAEERFKRVGEAYRILTDPAQRIVYHQKEEVRTRAKAAQKEKPTASFSELFKKVFQSGFGGDTGGVTASSPVRGKDQKITLELDAFELAEGTRRTLKVKRDVNCEVCGGTGIKPGHGLHECTICQGLGEVPRVKAGKTIFVTCTNCQGTGQIIKERCLNCGGRSIVRSSGTVTVDIPANSREGSVLRLREQGNAGLYRGKPGDLLIELLFKNSSYFERDEDDLIYHLPLNMLDVVAGGDVEVPTPKGKVKLTLKPGIAPDSILRVKGKGIPKAGGGTGDILVHIHYHFPDHLTAKARKLLADLVNQPEWSPKKDDKGFVPRSNGE